MTAKKQTVDIHHHNAAEIEQVKAKCTPNLLHGTAEGIVAIEHEGHQQYVAVVEGEGIGNQSPNLTVQDRSAIKDQKIVQNVVLRDGTDQIHKATAQGNVEHQIGNTLIPILETESLKASAQVFQNGFTPWLINYLYSISFWNKSPYGNCKLLPQNMTISLDKCEKADIIIQQLHTSLIKSGGGNGPMKPGNLIIQGAKSGGKREMRIRFVTHIESVDVCFCIYF